MGRREHFDAGHGKDEFRAHEGFPVEDVITESVNGTNVYRGRVAETPDPVIGFRGIGNMHELDSFRGLPGWRSQGGHTVQSLEGSTTMFGRDPEELMDPVHGYKKLLAVDLRGMQFQTLRRPESGIVAADIGLGLGVEGNAPLNLVNRRAPTSRRDDHERVISWDRIRSWKSVGGSDELSGERLHRYLQTKVYPFEHPNHPDNRK